MLSLHACLDCEAALPPLFGACASRMHSLLLSIYSLHYCMCRMEEVCEKTMERSSHEMEAARVEEERRLAKEREVAAQLRYAEELKV